MTPKQLVRRRQMVEATVVRNPLPSWEMDKKNIIENKKGEIDEDYVRY